MLASLPASNNTTATYTKPSVLSTQSFHAEQSGCIRTFSNSSLGKKQFEVLNVDVFSYGKTVNQKGIFYTCTQDNASMSSPSHSSVNDKKYMDTMRSELKQLLFTSSNDDNELRESLWQVCKNHQQVLANSPSLRSVNSRLHNNAGSNLNSPALAPHQPATTSNVSSPTNKGIVAASYSTSGDYLTAMKSELQDILVNNCNDDELCLTVLRIYENEQNNKDKKSSSGKQEEKDKLSNFSLDAKAPSPSSTNDETHIPANTLLWSSVCARLLDHATQNTIQIAPSSDNTTPAKHAELNKEFDALINHSCQPNVQFDSFDKSTNTIKFKSIKPIKPGDELRIDYEHTEERLRNPFTCDCKHSNCRGIITGSKSKNTQ